MYYLWGELNIIAVIETIIVIISRWFVRFVRATIAVEVDRCQESAHTNIHYIHYIQCTGHREILPRDEEGEGAAGSAVVATTTNVVGKRKERRPPDGRNVVVLCTQTQLCAVE